MALAICPTIGASNTSFLPRKRTGRPRLASVERHRQRVEVAAVVADDDAGPFVRDVLVAGDVEAGVRDQLRARQRHQRLLRLDADDRQLRHARPARRGARSASAGTARPRAAAGRGSPPPGARPPPAAAGRRSCRSRPSCRPATIAFSIAHSAMARSLPSPHTNSPSSVPSYTPSLLAVAGGDHVVEPERVGERLHQVVRRRGGEHERATRLAVLVEDRPGERLQAGGERLGGLDRPPPAPATAPTPTRTARPAW